MTSLLGVYMYKLIICVILAGAFIYLGICFSNNLKKKYLLIYGHAYGEELLLSCPSPGRSKHVVARYKGDIVNAYYGDYRIEATPEMLAVAYYCGLGSKNSIGFGFAELRSEHHIN